MKKYFYLLVIPLVFILPVTTFAYYDASLTNSDKCLLIKTNASPGAGGEYITAPSGFGDDDYKWASWYINGGTCSSGNAHNAGTQPDGSYVFTGAVFGAKTFYITGGVWSLTAPPVPPSPTGSTTVSIVLNPVEAVYFPAFFFLFLFGILIFYFRRR